MVALDDVLDHSEAMTADKGYSAPMPGSSQGVNSTRDVVHYCQLTNSHHEAPLKLGGQPDGNSNWQGGERTKVKRARNEMSIAGTGRGHSNGRHNHQDKLDAVQPSPPVPISEIAKQQLAQDGTGAVGSAN